MKKNVLVFGLISGFIVAAFMLVNVWRCYDNPDFEGNMIIGYASMLLAFCFVFVGIKNYRDKYNGGAITFGKAFRVGLYITLVSSSLYVLTWLFSYYLFIPDFMDRYSDYMIRQAQNSGASQAKIDETVAEMARYKEWYKNPLLVILLTYTEVLPIGIVVALISALILKRRPKGDGNPAVAAS